MWAWWLSHKMWLLYLKWFRAASLDFYNRCCSFFLYDLLYYSHLIYIIIFSSLRVFNKLFFNITFKMFFYHSPLSWLRNFKYFISYSLMGKPCCKPLIASYKNRKGIHGLIINSIGSWCCLPILVLLKYLKLIIIIDIFIYDEIVSFVLEFSYICSKY